MDQLTLLSRHLSLRQKVSLAMAAAVVAGAVLGFAHWSKERDMQPLYSGLAAEDAGAMVARLKEAGVDYRVSEGGSAILVPSGRVAELRLQMAAAGIPKTGRIGYELFDKTNVGTTEFAEQVNYRRALEGELERSVMALAEVEGARVHVTPAKDSLFLDAREPAKASVLVRLRPGRQLSAQNVQAITHLVASAVAGLSPDQVSLLDMNGNLLNRPRKPLAPDGMGSSDGTLDYRQNLERDLLAKINSTLEPLLGSERFRAGVSVDCDFSSAEQSEETFDPSRSVMVSAQKTEDLSGAPVASGMPGTASNMPRPTSRPGERANGLTRRTENITYQTSRTVRRTRLPQGTVKRVSVSVLVAHNVRWEGVGAKARRVVEAPSPERLKAIEKLVAGVAGIVAERGDRVIVESLPFEGVAAEPPPSEQAPPAPVAPLPVNLRWLPKEVTPVLLGVAGGVVLVLLVGVMLLLGRGKTARRRIEAEEAAAAVEAPSSAQAQLEAAEEARRKLEAQIVEQQAEHERKTLEAMQALKLPETTTKKAEVLTKHLSSEAKRRPDDLAHVLRTWLNDQE